VVSGIVMFQVILLTLMAANNSGREIAAERPILEKEKLAGLSPFAYVSSKVLFLLFFVVAQSVWMGVFVRLVCEFPGDFLSQLSFLFLVNAAITAICLGISSIMPNAEQASLVSIYLVGFQLPLSGAVLALPETLGVVVRPFISAYWSWSGILQTLRDNDYYDIVKSVAQSPLSPSAICFWVLGIHIVVGLSLAWIGSDRRRLI
ncbi:MAG: ABC transporter permease, partial [Verrucomicrobiales bacterium]|nr:ABC transporter permease [Verrucomicrobiales bacterium]